MSNDEFRVLTEAEVEAGVNGAVPCQKYSMARGHRAPRPLPDNLIDRVKRGIAAYNGGGFNMLTSAEVEARLGIVALAYPRRVLGTAITPAEGELLMSELFDSSAYRASLAPTEQEAYDADGRTVITGNPEVSE